MTPQIMRPETLLVPYACLVLLAAGGCTRLELLEVDRTSYLLAERGGVRPYHAICIAQSSGVIAHPARLRLYLVDRLPPSDDPGELRRVIRHTPRRLTVEDSRVGSLYAAASSLTSDEPPARLRWVLSVEPLAVAIGREHPLPEYDVDAALLVGRPSVEMGRNLRLTTEQDLDEEVIIIHTVTTWPEAARPDAAPPPDRTTIRLRAPTKIREALTIVRDRKD